MRVVCGLIVFWIGWTALVQAGDDYKKDRHAMQGTWKIVELTFFGEEAPKNKVQDGTYVFQGDKWFQKKGNTVQKKGKFQINVTKNPKTIDLLEQGGEKALGIYTLQKNTLTICARLPIGNKGNPNRPTKFSSTKKNGYALLN